MVNLLQLNKIYTITKIVIRTQEDSNVQSTVANGVSSEKETWSLMERQSYTKTTVLKNSNTWLRISILTRSKRFPRMLQHTRIWQTQFMSLRKIQITVSKIKFRTLLLQMRSILAVYSLNMTFSQIFIRKICWKHLKR